MVRNCGMSFPLNELLILSDGCEKPQNDCSWMRRQGHHCGERLLQNSLWILRQIFFYPDLYTPFFQRWLNAELRHQRQDSVPFLGSTYDLPTFPEMCVISLKIRRQGTTPPKATKKLSDVAHTPREPPSRLSPAIRQRHSHF